MMGLFFGFSHSQAQIEAKLQASDGTVLSGNVSISGDYAIVGGRGGAFVFKRDSGSWVKQAKLTILNELPDAEYKVSSSGANAVVQGNGAPFAFRRTGETWQPLNEIRGDAGRLLNEWTLLGDVSLFIVYKSNGPTSHMARGDV